MKKIILILVGILTINFVKAQVDTTIDMRFNNLEKSVLLLKANTDTLQLNLNKCHKEWILGGGLSLAGLGFSAIGTWLLIETTTNPTQKDPTVGYAMIGGGGLLSLIGTIVMLDSHKYIGRAGLSLGTNGITYRFK